MSTIERSEYPESVKKALFDIETTIGYKLQTLSITKEISFLMKPGTVRIFTGAINKITVLRIEGSGLKWMMNYFPDEFKRTLVIQSEDSTIFYLYYSYEEVLASICPAVKNAPKIRVSVHNDKEGRSLSIDAPGNMDLFISNLTIPKEMPDQLKQIFFTNEEFVQLQGRLYTDEQLDRLL